MELKLKIWDKEQKVMSKPFGLDWMMHNGDDLEFENGDTLPFNDFIFFKDDYEFIVCTGMKNKNNKLIWDGDLLMDGNEEYKYIYRVYWDTRYQWSTCLFSNSQFMGSLTSNEYIVPLESKFKTVGNIYQNPEITKKCQSLK